MSIMTDVRHVQVLVGDASIHVVEAGVAKEPAFLLLHGWPESWRSWKAVMALAALDVHCVAIDLPGIGGSGEPLKGGSKRTLAAQIHTLIGALDLTDVTLVGHDVGGMIAYSYLRQFDDVARVAIMDTVVPGVDPWDEVLRNPYIWHFAFHSIPSLPELLVQGNQAAYFDYFFDVLSAEPTKITPAARTEYVNAYRSLVSLSAGFDFYRSFRQDAEDNLAFSKGPPVDTPLLYVRGERELGGIETYASGLRRSGANRLTTAVVPGAGHFAPEENPAEVWRILHEFAAR